MEGWKAPDKIDFFVIIHEGKGDWAVVQLRSWCNGDDHRSSERNNRANDYQAAYHNGLMATI